MSLLGRELHSLGLDKDDPTVTAMAAMMTNEHNGICEIPNR
jgi:hypothetical protein